MTDETFAIVLTIVVGCLWGLYVMFRTAVDQADFRVFVERADRRHDVQLLQWQIKELTPPKPRRRVRWPRAYRLAPMRR